MISLGGLGNEIPEARITKSADGDLANPNHTLFFYGPITKSRNPRDMLGRAFGMEGTHDIPLDEEGGLRRKMQIILEHCSPNLRVKSTRLAHGANESSSRSPPSSRRSLSERRLRGGMRHRQMAAANALWTVSLKDGFILWTRVVSG